MNETKRFPLRVLLTVTTGRLLTTAKGPHDNGIDDYYEILAWMTNDTSYTHTLGRFNDECKPWLLRWFPELGIVPQRLGNLNIMIRMAKSEGTSVEREIQEWLAVETERCNLPDFYDVPRIPPDDHERKHPYDELVECVRGKP